MRVLGSVVALSVLVSACGSPPPPAPPPPAPPPVASVAPAPLTVEPPPPAPERVAVDTPRVTAGGASFTVPAGWTITTKDTVVVLETPEPDAHVALVDVDAESPDAAVAGAWKAYRPDSRRPLKLATDRPARDGWEQKRSYEYETSPNERMVVRAVALRRSASAWTVLILEAAEATLERRLASVRLVGDSLRPKGYQRETFAGKKAATLDDARKKALADFVELARRELGIPGVAVGIVQDGKIAVEAGYGVRELGKPKAIDKDTRFIVASNTKAMTTLLLAKLVDDGKFQWNTPVASVYPGFALGDAETTKSVEMRHLVCACTGLPRQDLEWLFEFKNATPATTMTQVGNLQPTTKFGETYQYSNQLAAAAGFVAAHVLHPKKELGAAYDEAMRAVVFEPLGMKPTFDFAQAVKGDHASPHGEDVDGKTALARMDVNRAVIPIRPAGGLWASVDDVLKFVSFELARGKLPNGKQWVSEKSVLARREPQVRIGEHATYGMGLATDTEWGVPVVQHSGSMIGYKSEMFWLPEQHVGVVLLTNAETGRKMLRPFQRRVLEVLFDGKPEAEADLVASAKALRDEIAKERERLVVPADPAIAGKLAGKYRNDALGEIVVRKEAGATVLDFGEWRSAVATRKNDDGTVSLITIDPGMIGIDLVVGEKGGKRVLVVRDAQHEYVLVEVAA